MTNLANALAKLPSSVLKEIENAANNATGQERKEREALLERQCAERQQKKA